jgi:hypothetical protein
VDPGKIPYFSGRSDLDSTLACARMVLSYFEPGEDFELADVSEMTGHEEGRWVFEAQLIPILEKKGYRAILHANTAYAQLAAGRGFEKYGPDAIKRGDPKALAWAMPFLNDGNFKPESASWDQVLAWFEQGDLVMIGADRAVLRSNPALPYCRYNLILTGLRGQTVRWHDPSHGPHRQSPASLIAAAFSSPPADRAVLRVRWNQG